MWKKTSLDNYPNGDYPRSYLNKMIKILINIYLTDKKPCFLEEVSLEQLIKNHNTPIYCYSLSELSDNFNKLKIHSKN